MKVLSLFYFKDTVSKWFFVPLSKRKIDLADSN